MTTTHRLCSAGIASLFSLILMPGAIWAQSAPPAAPPPYPDPNQSQYPPPPQQQPGQPQPYPQQYPPQPQQQYPQQGYPPQYPQAQQPYPQQPGYPQQYPPQPQQQPYPQAGYPQSYPPSAPYQVPPPQGHHGLLLAGFLGMHTFQGDTGLGLSPGLRLGGLLGGYASPVFSLNGELALDFLNFDNAGGASAARAVIAFSPLYHLPSGNVELVVGPKFGAWATSISFDDNTSQSAKGYVLGINAGVFVRAGNVNIGGLASFEAGYPTSICGDDGFGEVCRDTVGPEKDADKVLAITGAILF